MRKTLLLLTASFLMNTSFGQLQKGTWLVGGNGMYRVYKTKEDGKLISSVRDLSVLPNLGYFVIDKLATGLTLSGLFVNAKYPQPDGTTLSTKQQQIGAGPFARYYLLGAENTINVFSSAGAFYT